MPSCHSGLLAPKGLWKPVKSFDQLFQNYFPISLKKLYVYGSTLKPHCRFEIATRHFHRQTPISPPFQSNSAQCLAIMLAMEILEPEFPCRPGYWPFKEEFVTHPTSISHEKAGEKLALWQALFSRFFIPNASPLRMGRFGLRL